ncbi:DNA translocase FtsK [Shewanella marina]|uniref:DNA translocase FtsK n=1 Tax=Shewanella marina TaxID=487319 RepID=UPI0004718698|nr:DNA translocase FtsK [Shewanella marina]
MSQENNVKTLSGLQRLLEGGLILCCMLSAYILLALSSFHPSDPGWSQSNYQGTIENITGAVGAWIADVLLYCFGFTAYLVPFIVALTGWMLFKRAHKLLQIDYFSVGLRLVGFLLIVLSLAALASMNANDIYEFSAGGVAGEVIASAMLPYFNQLGTTLLLLCFVCAGFTLMTGISWITVVEVTGFCTIWCINAIRNIPNKFSRQNDDTEDTKGFMNVVERFREKRQHHQTLTEDFVPVSEFNIDEHLASNQAAQSIDVNEAHHFGDVPPQTTDNRVEPLLDIPFEQEAKVEPTFEQPQARVNEFEDNVVAMPQHQVEAERHSEVYSAQEQEHQPVAITQQQNTAAVIESVPVKAATDNKAKIVDGVVILPGHQELPVKPTDPLPNINLLDVPNRKANPITQEELDQVARLVEIKLNDFNIVAKVVNVLPGPVITRFELELAPGVKASKITNLSKDLARSLLSESVRVVEVIPGKPYVGLELPNKFRETVFMRDVLDSEVFNDSPSKLSMVLGSDISGEPVVVDLGKMPHLLVAGTTGSGKSVGVNVMITSLLYKSGPEDVRFIMIDPKMLELSVYEGIPHLLCEVVTDMKEASNALRWCVGEMERRYKLMSALGVRNLKGYNAKIAAAKAAGEPVLDPLWKSSESMLEEAPELDKLPSIVVIVDEFADMMMIVGKKVEELIARIAQKARAAGIHLILATQRPSVDVITGLIKANIPTRIAFQVSSRIDSRTILDQQGAETLLGMGDMLYLPPGTSVPSRVHGAFIDDHEVHAVVADWCARGKPQYLDEILQGGAEGEQVLLPGEVAESDEDTDALYDEAVAFVTETRRGSISSVQRKFKIGYNRAARIIESMEAQGVVSAQGHNGNREVLAPPPPRSFN